MLEHGRADINSRMRPNSIPVCGPRLQWPVSLLAVAALVLALACGETVSPDAGPVEELAAALDQPSDVVPEEASSGSPLPTERTGPVFAAKFSTPDEPKERGELRIATLLPRDAIPSIDSPKFLDAEGASEQMGDDDLVIGVSIEGEHKAYSTAFLSSHEIVNDVVGGKPVAVTW